MRRSLEPSARIDRRSARVPGTRAQREGRKVVLATSQVRGPLELVTAELERTQFGRARASWYPEVVFTLRFTRRLLARAKVAIYKRTSFPDKETLLRFTAANLD
jgi:hypothetical protein